MKKESLYLETSVVSAYYDDRDSQRQIFTLNFWKISPEYEVYVSQIVQTELEATQEKTLRSKFVELIKDVSVLKISEEEESLGNKYIQSGIIPLKYRNDAYHVAVATINALDYMVSWNMEHMVKVKTRRMVNLVNLQNGYKSIEIITPTEL